MRVPRIGGLRLGVARRIIYAEQSGSSRDSSRALFIDRWVEIDWRPKLFLDGRTGDGISGPPSFRVGVPGRAFAQDPSAMCEYGIVKDAEDIAWLKQATDRERARRPAPVISRVHQLELDRDGRPGFAIEVMTGEDAKDRIDKAKRERAIATVIDLWWLIVPGIFGLWLFS